MPLRIARFAAASIAALSVACGPAPQAPQQPNLVLVVADTLRADHLGFRGFEGPISPHLDRLAAESLSFDRAVSAAPWTKPAIASLFTSLSPDEHGMVNADDFAWQLDAEVGSTQRLSGKVATLAEQLRDAGYTTVARVSNPWLMRVNGFARGFDDWRGVAEGGGGDAASIVAELETLRGQQPFFLYLHRMEPHGPYGGHAGSEDEFRTLWESPSLAPGRRITKREAALRPAYLGENLTWHRRADAAQLRNWRAAYAQGVAALDREVGEVIEGLRRSGLLDHTVVVFTSDHGEEFLEHGVWEHGERLCRHQLDVPLLFRLPDGARAGERDDTLVGTVDLMPTLLALAGVDASGLALGGRDLSPRLRSREAVVPQRSAFASGVKARSDWRSVRGDRFKLVARGDDLRLYDLRRDPDERHALAAEPGLDPEVDALLDALARRPAGEARRAERATESATQADVEALRALGYVE